MVNVNDITVTSIETITAFDIVSGSFKWVLDELQNAKIANTQETTDITGKQGRLLNTLKKNKAVTVSGSNGLISGGLLETQVGNSFENKLTNVMYPDYLTVTDNKATTTYKAVGTAGNEIEKIYVRNEDGTLGKVLTQDTTASASKFAYDPATRVITFYAGDTGASPAVPADLPDGTEIAVYYFRKIQANVLENMSDHYSEKVSLYIDAFAEDKCANIYRVQFYIPKADFNGNFDLEFGENQSAHAFEARSLAGSACNGTGGGAATLWTYTIFGEDTEDAEDPKP